ncbi:MAG: adenylyltransferase/cytidyltransferase family protein [Dehalococcoidia bacterium]
MKVAIAGGFDPIHPGHIKHIEETLKLGEIIIILARDDQLIKKKGKCVIPYQARKQILEWGLRGRGQVVENIDTDITCKSSLRLYKPDIFAKGGDTWDINNLPEKEVCGELGIKIMFGVGGYDKPYSSSKFNT